MPVQGALEKYVVKPGDKLKLGDKNTNEKSLFEGSKEDSIVALDELRAELKELQNQLYAQDKKSLLVVIQAMDTGGKDGCVKSVFATVDPQGIMVTPFKKPSEEELAHDFLWRVHAKAPRNGQISVFNRSHYEDIIAVKVKKIFPEKVWKKRFRHVKDFEQLLVDEGTTVVKIFLNISKDEQQQRLQARLDNPEKHWKFNPDDLLDRARWDEFMDCYEDLLEKTSTEDSPWFVIPSDRKWYRNLAVTRILVDTLKSMNLSYPEIDWDPEEMEIK